MRTFIFVLLAAVGSLLALHLRREDAEPSWEFQSDLRMEVAWRLPTGGAVSRGHFSICGTFVPDVLATDTTHILFAGFGADKPRCANDPQGKLWDDVFYQTEIVYEFRSGSLILGTLQFPGTFIPEVDEQVLWIDDWKPTQKNGKPSPRIYNLPGKMVPVPAGQRRKLFQAVPKYESGSDWERDGKVHPRPKSTMTFEEDTDRLVGLLRSGTVYIGRLSMHGDFYPEPDIKPVAYEEEAIVKVELPDGKKRKVPVFNHARVEAGFAEEVVFELRGGHSLLYGRLTAAGTFIPFEGGRMIPFALYESLKEKHRIYNLPGELTFVPAIAPPPRSRP